MLGFFIPLRGIAVSVRSCRDFTNQCKGRDLAKNRFLSRIFRLGTFSFVVFAQTTLQT